MRAKFQFALSRDLLCDSPPPATSPALVGFNSLCRETCFVTVGQFTYVIETAARVSIRSVARPAL